MALVKLEGNFNLRDIGGYTNADGKRVREGVLFRSDELHALTEADLEVFASLGIRVLFDLRNETERSLKPNPVLDGVEVHERDAPPAEGGSLSLEDQIATGITPQRDDEEFGGVYVFLLTHLADDFRRVVELAVDAAERPLLYHCVAGKDRTGITSAILLGLLGVDDETILDDYELTTEYWTPNRIVQMKDFLDEHGADHDHIRHLISARRPVLTKAINHIHSEYGGYEGYVTQVLGIPPESIERMRATLLT